MSYRVTYGKELPCERIQKRRWLPLAVFAGTLIITTVAHYLWQDELKQLTQALFPWTRPEVRLALSAFLERIEQGTGVGDAVFAFCREIVHASKVY